MEPVEADALEDAVSAGEDTFRRFVSALPAADEEAEADDSDELPYFCTHVLTTLRVDTSTALARLPRQVCSFT